MRLKRRSLCGALASVAATTVLLCGSAASAESNAANGSRGATAVWTPKEVEFVYHGVTTKYTCDGLRTRMKAILIKLGARPDVHVSVYGCTHAHAPELFPTVSIRMNVLQSAGQDAGKAVPAHWQTVDLLANQDAINAATDCELIQQIKQQVLPLFDARDVDYSAACQAHGLLIGGTKLKADVLVADNHPPTEPAFR